MPTSEPNIDLHTHSYFSDGILSPADLVQRAVGQGVSVLALTDHDTTAGIAQAQAAAQALELELIAGVEISTSWSGHTIHVLGLRIDVTSSALQQGIAQIALQREERAMEMGRKLEKAGIPAAFENAKQLAGIGLVTRTHFARYILSLQKAKTMQQVFERYLGQGKAGFVNAQWASIADAVAWIRQAGGQAVIAHPARYKMTATKLRSLIKAFKEAGGEGLEVAYGNYSAADMQKIANLAVEFALLASRGSDFHGIEHQYAEVGRAPPLPGQVTPIWKDWPAH